MNHQKGYIEKLSDEEFIGHAIGRYLERPAVASGGFLGVVGLSICATIAYSFLSFLHDCAQIW